MASGSFEEFIFNLVLTVVGGIVSVIAPVFAAAFFSLLF
jgi:hypothetical protein